MLSLMPPLLLLSLIMIAIVLRIGFFRRSSMAHGTASGANSFDGVATAGGRGLASYGGG